MGHELRIAMTSKKPEERSIVAPGREKQRLTRALGTKEMLHILEKGCGPLVLKPLGPAG